MSNLPQTAAEIEVQPDLPQRAPLTPEQILDLAPQAQAFFARNFGGAPGYWTDEQVRTCREFQAAITDIVRATETLHRIG